MIEQQRPSVSSYYSCKGLAKRIADKFYNASFRSGTVMFYDLIRDRLSRGSVVLDLGAGAGRGVDNLDRSLIECGVVRVGVDIDPSIRENPTLDHKVIGNAENMPFSSESFDIVFADYVMEHIERPQEVCREVCRLLKPKGYFIFRTNNLLHYSTLVSKVTSHSSHLRISGSIVKVRDNPEPFPTVYAFNTRAEIERIAVKSGFERADLTYVEREPAYLMFNWVAISFGLVYERATNRLRSLEKLRANIYGVLRK